jgi:hypothetical protein
LTSKVIKYRRLQQTNKKVKQDAPKEVVRKLRDDFLKHTAPKKTRAGVRPCQAAPGCHCPLTQGPSTPSFFLTAACQGIIGQSHVARMRRRSPRPRRGCTCSGYSVAVPRSGGDQGCCVGWRRRLKDLQAAALLTGPI